MEGNMTVTTTKRNPAAEVGCSDGAISGHWYSDQHGHPSLGLPKEPAPEERRADQVILALARLWPRTFFVDPERRLPLEIGIGEELKEIMAPAIKVGRISTHDINIAIRRYVDSRGYLEACLFNAPRLGLRGEPAGRVSYRQSLYAQERLRVGRF
jgi:sRNA-binding protein